MTIEQYIRALEEELKYLPKEEREEALLYYREYFDDAAQSAEDGTYDPVQEFGMPKELAGKIISESAGKRLDEKPATGKKSMETVWVVILAILASPIALPIGIAIIAVMVSMLAAVISVGAAFFGSAVGLTFGGLAGIVCGAVLTVSEPATGVLLMGGSFLLLGIGCLLCVIGYWLVKGLIYLITVLFGSLVKNKKGGAAHE